MSLSPQEHVKPTHTWLTAGHWQEHNPHVTAAPEPHPPSLGTHLLWDVHSCARPSDSLSSLLSRSQQAMVRAVLVASEEGQAWQKQKSHPLQTFWILLPKS